MTSLEKSKLWLENPNVPEDLKEEIRNASEDQIEDMFYRTLEVFSVLVATE